MSEEILELGNVEVKTNSKLHAKVLVQKSSAIVGSANISANGLSFEGSELNGWIEAGLIIDDESIINEISNWYKKMWNLSRSITKEDDLVEYKNSWRKKRNQRPLKSSNLSIIEALLNDADEFIDREIYFTIHKDQNLSNEASVVFDAAVKSYSNLSETITCYEGWNEIPDDAYLISVYCGPRGGVDIEGIYKTPDEALIDTFQYNDKSQGEIKLCFERKSIYGHKLTTKDKTIIKKSLKALIDLHSHKEDALLIKLYDAVDVFRNCI